MEFLASIFLMALGLACVLEALPWVASPERTREALLFLSEQEPHLLQRGGILLLGFGVLLIWIGRL